MDTPLSLSILILFSKNYTIKQKKLNRTEIFTLLFCPATLRDAACGTELYQMEGGLRREFFLWESNSHCSLLVFVRP